MDADLKVTHSSLCFLAHISNISGRLCNPVSGSSVALFFIVCITIHHTLLQAFKKSSRIYIDSLNSHFRDADSDDFCKANTFMKQHNSKLTLIHKDLTCAAIILFNLKKKLQRKTDKKHKSKPKKTFKNTKQNVNSHNAPLPSIIRTFKIKVECLRYPTNTFSTASYLILFLFWVTPGALLYSLSVCFTSISKIFSVDIQG